MKNITTFNKNTKQITSRSFQDFTTQKKIDNIILKIKDEIIINKAPENIKYPIFDSENWAEDQEKILSEQIQQKESYLSSTDWYAWRKIDNNKDIPIDIQQKRQQMRDEISQLRQELKEL